MTDSELKEKAVAISSQIVNLDITDEEIMRQIREFPEVIKAVLPSSENLFLKSVIKNRFEIAKELAKMGADIHLKCKPSLIMGNALNVAHSPEQAEYLLGLGVEIERNLSIREPFVNPAMMAVLHNDKIMLFYWMNKQKEIFAADKQYVSEMIHAIIETVAAMNQYNMLSAVIADEELYITLKEIYSTEDSEESIKLALRALRQVKDEELQYRKKELCKVLNTRKKEILI